MLAEIFLMLLQTRVREAARAGVTIARDRRFVPIAPLRDRAAGGVRPA
jgi:hypothetical protein